MPSRHSCTLFWPQCQAVMCGHHHALATLPPRRALLPIWDGYVGSTASMDRFQWTQNPLPRLGIKTQKVQQIAIATMLAQPRKFNGPNHTTQMWWEIPVCNTASDQNNIHTNILCRQFIAAYFNFDMKATFQQQACSKCWWWHILKKRNWGNSVTVAKAAGGGGGGWRGTQFSVSRKEPVLAKCLL
jgi:hypothetical protein